MEHHVAGVALVVVVPGRSQSEAIPAVGVDLQGTVVERRVRRGALVGRIRPGHDLERQVRGGTAPTLDLVLGAVGEVGVEVQRVRVVQAHLGVRARDLEQLRVRTLSRCRPVSMAPRMVPSR